MLYYFGNKAPLIFSFMKSQICKGSDNYSLYFSNLSQSRLWLLYSSDLYSKFRKTPKSKSNLKTHKPVCAQSVQIIPGFVCLELECLNSTLNSSPLFCPSSVQVPSYRRSGGHKIFNRPSRLWWFQAHSHGACFYLSWHGFILITFSFSAKELLCHCQFWEVFLRAWGSF